VAVLDIIYDPEIVELGAWMRPLGLEAFVPAMVSAGIASVSATKAVPPEMISRWEGYSRKAR
jgi:hypothetical protein